MNALLEQKLERCETLPTLPAVALKIVRLCQQDDASTSDLTSLVSTDPALSAKLLKLVNSAAFGQRQEVRTLSHAVILMGTSALRALALSFALVPDPTRRRHAVLVAFWKRALASAIAARELARIVDRARSEEAFLCGLLQDLGMLALARALGAEYRDLQARAGDDHEALAALEHRVLGADHAEVGAWLLGRWHLPPVMRVATALSHGPSRLEEPMDAETSMLVRITSAAGLLADVWLRPDLPSAIGRVKIRVTGLFQLDEAALETLLRRIAEGMTDIAPLFDVDLGQVDDVLRVLEEARETLLTLNLKASARIEAAQRTIQELEDRAETLEREAQRDPLTGLCNRRSVERYLENEFAVAFYTGTPLTVILGDIDSFKAVNDGHGHPVGDQVLKEIAGTLTASLRLPDLVGRYGGEEFLIVLPNTPTSGALAVAERLRQRVEALEVTVDPGKVVRVTVSLGLATARPGVFTSHAEVVRAADDALYASKHAGRNRVVAHQPRRGSQPDAPADHPGGSRTEYAASV